jgi:hypothetical protein
LRGEGEREGDEGQRGKKGKKEVSAGTNGLEKKKKYLAVALYPGSQLK